MEMEETVKKNGLIYSVDLKTVYGIDSDSAEFQGIVPNGAERIEEDAFSCCDLSEISLPDSVVEVGANLFCNSKNLIRVKLPSGLKKLSPFMFYGCSSLKRIEMPLEVEEFPEGLFAECFALEEIPFRAGIRVLPENVFLSCSSLKSLVIPGTVKKICKNAISGCSELSTVVLPEELEEFEEDAITDCPELSRIRILEENTSFFTDEEGTSLFRKNPDGQNELVFEIGKKIQSEVPDFSPIPESENPSVIDYSNDAEENDDSDEIDLFSAGKKNVIINGDNALKSGNNESRSGILESALDADRTESDSSENEINSELKVEPENEAEQKSDAKEIEETNVEVSEIETAENPAENPNMDSLLAEIMSQGKLYDDGDFSIMNIPEATEEEIQAEKLTPTEHKEDFVPSIEIPKPVVHESSGETQESMDERIADIMSQEIYNFSISAIPEASQADIEADRIVAEGDFAAGVESADSSVPEIPVSDSDEENYDDDEKAVMNNMIFESDKIEQINLIPDAEEQKILFVFAENLAEGQFGKIFSSRLVKCAKRLAEIHKYTSIYMFSGVDIENEKFRIQFSRYMKDKSVVIACSAGTLSAVDERTREFAGLIGVPLEKDALDEQVRLARSEGADCIKLLIQDNLAE